MTTKSEFDQRKSLEQQLTDLERSYDALQGRHDDERAQRIALERDVAIARGCLKFCVKQGSSLERRDMSHSAEFALSKMSGTAGGRG